MYVSLPENDPLLANRVFDEIESVKNQISTWRALLASGNSLAHRLNMTSVPWWLTGDEICSGCGGPYSFEVEIRCVSCDAGFCTFCIAVATHAEPDCGSCGESEEER